MYPTARVLAYGSRARGDATWGSDLDVCVILPVVTSEMEQKIGRIAWEVGFDNEVLIMTITFDRETFDRQARGRIPFVWHRRRFLARWLRPPDRGKRVKLGSSKSAWGPVGSKFCPDSRASFDTRAKFDPTQGLVSPPFCKGSTPPGTCH
ncbi:MAG: nucleotidyltransferase domain-containing protein [Deltaproteobacteria bacterium]|nr:nucleotidyltransferase domain-containing protein [Deltaproteobacteria bacterium]